MTTPRCIQFLGGGVIRKRGTADRPREGRGRRRGWMRPRPRILVRGMGGHGEGNHYRSRRAVLRGQTGFHLESSTTGLDSVSVEE